MFWSQGQEFRMKIIILVLISAVVIVLARTLVLSRHRNRFTSHIAWLYDTGILFAWLGHGVILLILFALYPILYTHWLSLIIVWLVGMIVIWRLPPYLAKFL